MPTERSRTVLNRLGIIGGVLLGVCGLSLVVTAQAINSPSTYSEAIGFFAQEKSSAESGAALLKMFREKEKVTIEEYARGAQGYAKAKAAFDGLIAQLDAEACDASEQASSERFQVPLQQAAEARIAFTNDVETTLRPYLQGTRFPFTVNFETVGELLPTLADAWNKLREARRHQAIQEVREQLESIAWRPFNDIDSTN